MPKKKLVFELRKTKKFSFIENLTVIISPIKKYKKFYNL